MRAPLLILCIFFSSFFAEAQGELLARWDMHAEIAKVDKLGQVYLVNGSRIEKFDKKGNSIGVYDRSDLGNLSSIDLSDPFKPVLFFEEHAGLVFCDSRLEILNKTDLRVLGIFQAVAVCSSPSQGFWVFNQQDFKLTKFDSRFKVIQESEELSRFTDVGILQGSLAERNDRVFLQTSSGRILIFDRFANLIQSQPDSSATAFSWAEREYYFIDGNKIMSKNSSTNFGPVNEYFSGSKPLLNADKSGNFVLLVYEDYIELREFKF